MFSPSSLVDGVRIAPLVVVSLNASIRGEISVCSPIRLMLVCIKFTKPRAVCRARNLSAVFSNAIDRNTSPIQSFGSLPFAFEIAVVTIFFMKKSIPGVIDALVEKLLGILSWLSPLLRETARYFKGL